MRSSLVGFAGLLVAISTTGCGSSASQVTPSDGGSDAGGSVDLVLTDGPIHGQTALHVRSWMGIPYAAPPKGNLRWKAPAPPTPWTAPLDATAAASECPQTSVTTGKYSSGDEDCLYLNVWSPDPAPAKPAPVMVWLHGGAFLVGSGSQPFYDGTALVQVSGAVVVTINYRLGALGFLGHSALAAEDPAHGSGNYGLLDQQAALRWVKKNIAVFGGDPSNVTVFGESAGGMSVTAHLMAKSSGGLFSKAIIESGAGPVTFSLPALDAATAQAEALGKALGCTSAIVDCLRGKSVKDIIGGLPNPTTAPGGLFEGVTSTAVWLPVLDGSLIASQPRDAFTTGPIANVVPTLLGSNLNEGTLFHHSLLGDRPVKTAAEYEALVNKMFGSHGPDVLARYPATSGPTFDAALALLESDAAFTCPTRMMARALTKAGAKVWRYQFTRTPDTGIISTLGATHAAEIAFVFGNQDAIYGGVTTSQPLRDAMMRYWTRFSSSSDPNGAPDPSWPLYTVADDPYMLLDIPQVAKQGLLKDACDFWDTLPPFSVPKTY